MLDSSIDLHELCNLIDKHEKVSRKFRREFEKFYRTSNELSNALSEILHRLDVDTLIPIAIPVKSIVYITQENNSKRPARVVHIVIDMDSDFNTKITYECKWLYSDSTDTDVTFTNKDVNTKVFLINDYEAMKAAQQTNTEKKG